MNSKKFIIIGIRKARSPAVATEEATVLCLESLNGKYYEIWFYLNGPNPKNVKFNECVAYSKKVMEIQNIEYLSDSKQVIALPANNVGMPFMYSEKHKNHYTIKDNGETVFSYYRYKDNENGYLYWNKKFFDAI